MTFLFCVCSAGTSTNYLLLASSCQVYKLWFLVVQSHVLFLTTSSRLFLALGRRHAQSSIAVFAAPSRTSRTFGCSKTCALGQEISWPRRWICPVFGILRVWIICFDTLPQKKVDCRIAYLCKLCFLPIPDLNEWCSRHEVHATNSPRQVFDFVAVN